MMITERAKRGNWGKEIEMFKQEYFVEYNNIAQASSELAKKETNDCVVKAFMIALNISYDQAHAYIKDKMKRIDLKGTYTSAYAKNIVNTTKNGKKITFIGTHPSRAFMSDSIGGTKKILANKQYKKPTGYTLKSFMENNPVGSFVLIVQGHAVAIVNGVLFGNHSERYEGIYRSVWYGFEMK